MKKGIVGKKIGMTQIFTEDGRLIPVTVIEAGPCPVVQKKTMEKDGYEAIQVGFDAYAPNRAEKLVNKPLKGHFAKAEVAPTRKLRELRLDDCSAYNVGDEVKVDVFAAGDKVDITGTSKGHGFTGVIQRWNQHTGPMAHGSSITVASAPWVPTPRRPACSRTSTCPATTASTASPFRT